MKVWLLYDGTDRLEGVYSESAKEVREQQFYEEALACSEQHNNMTVMTRQQIIEHYGINHRWQEEHVLEVK